jgi:hypothetical protein
MERAWPEVQADVLQPDSEPVVADGLSGAASGEQPRRGAGAADGGVAAAGGDEFADEADQEFGEDDRSGAKHDLHLVAVVADMIGGELDDAGDALSVEQQEQPGDPVGGREHVVVQER